MNELQKLTFTRVINVNPAAVYYALTNGTALREWLADVVEAEGKVNGRLYLWWTGGYYAAGTYVEMVENSCVKFTWHGRAEPADTYVQVHLTAQNGGTLVSLTHAGVGRGAAWDNVVEEYNNGWQSALENLQSVLETGIDLRVARRPMLGILYGAEITPELAAEQGLPMPNGFQLGGVVPGMGAELAGLAKDDIVVCVEDYPIDTFAAFGQAIMGKKAGESVEVTFYRGVEKQVANMALSARPQPELPETAVDLAEKTGDMFAEVDAELEAILNDFSAEAAAYRPAPDEWCAQEVLAHLIGTVRDTHNWVGSLVAGRELNIYSSDLNVRVQATVAAYASMAELWDELQQCQRELVFMLERLPDDFVARKGAFAKVAQNMHFTPYHHDGHLEQLRVLLAAAGA